MNISVARTIVYTILLVAVNFLNIAWFGNSQEGFISLFIIGSIVGEVGMPAFLPSLVKKEQELVSILNEKWRRIALATITTLLLIASVVLATNAFTIHPPDKPQVQCIKNYK